MAKYRIVKGDYDNCYRVQVRRWLVWSCPSYEVFATVPEAEDYAKNHRAHGHGRFVKYVD